MYPFIHGVPSLLMSRAWSDLCMGEVSGHVPTHDLNVWLFPSSKERRRFTYYL